MRYMPVRFPGCLMDMEDCAIAGQALPLAALETARYFRAWRIW